MGSRPTLFQGMVPVTSLWSDSPLVRQPVGPTARWSDNPLKLYPVDLVEQWNNGNN